MNVAEKNSKSQMHICSYVRVLCEALHSHLLVASQRLIVWVLVLHRSLYLAVLTAVEGCILAGQSCHIIRQTLHCTSIITLVVVPERVYNYILAVGILRYTEIY